MKTRAITAFFFTIVMLASLINGYAFTAFYLVLSTLALLEFYKMIKIGGIRPHRNIGVFAAVVMFSLNAAYYFYQFSKSILSVSIKIFTADRSSNIFSIYPRALQKKQNPFC